VSSPGLGRRDVEPLFFGHGLGDDLLRSAALLGHRNGLTFDTHDRLHRCDVYCRGQRIERQRIAVIAVIVLRQFGGTGAWHGGTGTIEAGTLFPRPILAGTILAGTIITLVAILAYGTVFSRTLRTCVTVLASRTVVTILFVAILVAAVLVAALGAVLAGAILAGTILALVAVLTGRLFLAVLLGRPRIELALDLVAVLVELLFGLGIVLARAVGVRFFEARATFGEHAEIMVGELEIIFRKHPVARLLRIARERLVLFEQLWGIATRAVIDAIAEFGSSVLRALAILATPAATATGLLAIIDQADAVLNKGGVQIPFCPISRCRIRTAGRSAASPSLSIIARDRRMWG
jgi:hypothetical protein